MNDTIPTMVVGELSLDPDPSNGVDFTGIANHAQIGLTGLPKSFEVTSYYPVVDDVTFSPAYLQTQIEQGSLRLTIGVISLLLGLMVAAVIKRIVSSSKPRMEASSSARTDSQLYEQIVKEYGFKKIFDKLEGSTIEEFTQAVEWLQLLRPGTRLLPNHANSQQIVADLASAFLETNLVSSLNPTRSNQVEKLSSINTTINEWSSSWITDSTLVKFLVKNLHLHIPKKLLDLTKKDTTALMMSYQQFLNQVIEKSENTLSDVHVRVLELMLQLLLFNSTYKILLSYDVTDDVEGDRVT